MNRWRQLEAKYEALSMREKVIVLAGSVLVLGLGFNALYFDPLAAKQKLLALKLAESRAEVRVLDAGLGEQSDPDAARRSYRDGLRTQVAGIDQNMKSLQKRLVPPDEVPKMLQGVLGASPGVSLVSLRKLPAQVLELSGGDKAAKKGGPADPRTIFQHGFELTIQGSYNELHEYLSRLEKMPWQLYWGRVELVADSYPKVKLSITVHTLSLDKSWLAV
jgi:MSHA biogenesis protein MshJ